MRDSVLYLSRSTSFARLDQHYRVVLCSAPVVTMPVGLEQWRAAVGAWNAKIGRPPTLRLCQPWRGWMKRSDPAVYKAYLVLIVTLLDVVKSVSRRVKERVRVSLATGPRCSSALRVVVAVLFVMLVAIFSVVLSLLIIAGDVEQNPGPPKGTCVYGQGYGDSFFSDGAPYYSLFTSRSRFQSSPLPI